MKRATLALVVCVCALLSGVGVAQASSFSQQLSQAPVPILPAPQSDCRADYGTGHAQAALEGLACPSSKTRALPVTRSTGLREMDDSTDLGALLGTDYPAYAGYTDGLFQSYGDIYAHFHPLGKQTVGIDVLGGSARSTDLEPSPGNFQNNPFSAGPWARGEINNTSNKRPVVYTMGSWQGAIEQSLADSGVPRCSTPTQQGCYLEWIAVWDNNPVLYAHMTVHQFINHGPGFENRDRSVYDPSMLFPSSPTVDGPSFNEGFQTGYATGRSIPFKRGFVSRHPVGFAPSSTADYDSGYNKGWSSGWHYSANSGTAAGRIAPVNPTTFNGSFNLGFDNGWAIAVWQPYYNYWKLTRHGTPSSSAGFNAGYTAGKPKGYNTEFNQGYLAPLT